MIPHRFGFTLDGTSTSPELGDPLFHATLIRDLAEEAGMRLLDLAVKDVEGEVPKGERWVDEGGISSHGLISTSHISLHTWPKDSFFMLDVVSCRPFRIEQVKAFVMLRLQVETVKRYQVTVDDDGDANLDPTYAGTGPRPAGRAAPPAPG
jgi:S-adenosylmethionine/arginine decarboxylase-like enzyme